MSDRWTMLEYAELISSQFFLQTTLNREPKMFELATHINQSSTNTLYIKQSHNAVPHGKKGRTVDAFCIKIMRIHNAIKGSWYYSDGKSEQIALNSMNNLRVILSVLDVKMVGPIRLPHLTRRRWSLRDQTGPRAFTPNNKQPNTYLSSVMIYKAKPVDLPTPQELYKARVDLVKSRYTSNGRIDSTHMLRDYTSVLVNAGYKVNIKTTNTIKRYSNYKLTDPKFRATFSYFVDVILNRRTDQLVTQLTLI